ncbi:MAG: DUF4199 domain-containing protein [Allomuricauda sp.]|nr:MAG: DUF4199 domain-containing protein [Allomuricauda sp.]
MEENQPKIGKYALKWGLIAGVIGLAFNIMLMIQEMHYEQNTIAGVIGVSILFAVIAFGINQLKKDNGGFLKLGQGIKAGIGIALVSGIVGLIWYALLTNDIVEAGYMEKATELARQKQFAANPSLTQEQWDQGLEMQKKFAWMAYPIVLIFNIILGLIAGLIFGLIMKNDKDA